VEPGADTATDPVCGMTVALGDTAILLTRDGRTYAFCGDPCRQVFVEQLAARSGPTH
jgi:Cu+-exporting ATPase